MQGFNAERTGQASMSERTELGCGILLLQTLTSNKDYDAMRESISGISAGFKPFINVFRVNGQYFAGYHKTRI